MGNGTVENNLKRKRVLADMTQEDLAKQVGVTRQTIIAMEKGNYVPSVLLALRIAKTFDCPVEEIFYVEE